MMTRLACLALLAGATLGCSNATKENRPSPSQDDAEALRAFRETCIGMEKLDAAKQATVRALLAAAGSTDCATASETLSRTKELHLGGTDAHQISDLSPIAAFTQLETLWLGDNPVADVSPLSKLTHLRFLDLFFTNVVDFSPLASLTELEYLSFVPRRMNDPHFTSRNIEVLKGMTNLQSLTLSGANLASAEFLAGLKNIRRLTLTSNPLSDVSFLSTFSRLEFLQLSHNVIHDFSFLKAVPKGAKVFIDHNPVPPELCPTETENPSVNESCARERKRSGCLSQGLILDFEHDTCASAEKKESFKDVTYSPGAALLDAYFIDYADKEGGDRVYPQIDGRWFFSHPDSRALTSFSLGIESLACASNEALRDDLIQKARAKQHQAAPADSGQGLVGWLRFDLATELRSLHMYVFERNPVTGRCALLALGGMPNPQNVPGTAFPVSHVERALVEGVSYVSP